MSFHQIGSREGAKYDIVIPRPRVGYEMIDNIIVSYPTSTSGIIVLLEKKKKEILLDLADFVLQEQPEDIFFVNDVVANITWTRSQANP